MIIKIKSHKRPAFKALLEYMLNNKERLFDSERRTFVVTHNLKGSSLKSWEKQFRENESFRLRKRKDSVKLTHEILSWNRSDTGKITLRKLEDMTRQYVRERNPKGMYVAVPHFDRDHYHVHILCSGVEYRSGKSLRLSKTDFMKLKKHIQEYQIERFPELTNSVVKHGRVSRTYASDIAYQIKRRTGRITEREKVSKIILDAFHKSSSMKAFYKRLEQSGLNIYERSSKPVGIVYKGYKFRFTRLGFPEERIKVLDRSQDRSRQIKELRGKEVYSPGRNL